MFFCEGFALINHKYADHLHGLRIVLLLRRGKSEKVLESFKF